VRWARSARSTVRLLQNDRCSENGTRREPYPAEATDDVWTSIAVDNIQLEPRINVHDEFPLLWGFPPNNVMELSDIRCLTEEAAVLSRLSPKTLRALENDVQALRLRLQGATFEEIAAALGYRTRSAAWKCVFRARTSRLIELARLVEQLELAESQQRLAAIERRIQALNTGVGVRPRQR
jgi:hypothetical protein